MTIEWDLSDAQIGFLHHCVTCGGVGDLRTTTQWENVISTLSFLNDDECCWANYYSQVTMQVWHMLNIVAVSKEGCCFACYKRLLLRVKQVVAFEEKKRALQQ